MKKGFTWYKFFRFKITLWWNCIRTWLDEKLGRQQWKWWSQIEIPKSELSVIYLGALPIRIKIGSHVLRDDFTTLTQELGIKAILSIVEEYELFSKGIVTPISPTEWQSVGIQQMTISVPDFNPIEIAQINQATDFIHDCIQQGLPLYIHCKAGRGRSALVLLCYLMKYCKMDLTIAYALMKKCRPQILLEKTQWKCAEHFSRSFNFSP